MTAAIATAIAALATLALWLLKRRHEPTPEQREADREREIDRLAEDITAARVRGDDARADALLRRLSDLTAADRAERSPGTDRQRNPHDAA